MDPKSFINHMHDDKSTMELIEYLEPLWKVEKCWFEGKFNHQNHEMLLLNAYVKQKDSSKLSKYIEKMESTKNLFENEALFDIEAAIDLCR